MKEEREATGRGKIGHRGRKERLQGERLQGEEREATEGRNERLQKG